MKKIFIVIDSGFPIRNLLRNKFWQQLTSSKNIEITLFSPVVDSYFVDEFSSENVNIRKRILLKHNFFVKFLKSTKRLIWSVPAESISFDMKLTLKKGVFYKIFVRIARAFPKTIWYRLHEYITKIEMAFIPQRVKRVITSEKPDAIFFTTIFARNQAIELEAFKNKIKTIAFVQSWDNPTTKGPMPFEPDVLAVWNETIKEEMVQFHGFDDKKIHVVGVPQFDHYVNFDGLQSFDNFLAENNLKTTKKILCYTTGTPWTCPYDHDLIEVLCDLVNSDSFCDSCQIIVRTHPNDDRDYSKLREKHGVEFHSLGDVKNSKDNWGPSKKDMYRFASLMKYSDVVINVASTTTIDAAAFDTPIVNIAFDGYENKEYFKSNRRYYKYCHYENIVKTGGVSVCYDIDQLIEAVNEYLQTPEKDSGGRKKIVNEQCWKLDGNSGERLATLLLDEA